MTRLVDRPSRELERALLADIEQLREGLRAALLENKLLRLRLRTVRVCADLKCSLCAACLAAVREA